MSTPLETELLANVHRDDQRRQVAAIHRGRQAASDRRSIRHLLAQTLLAVASYLDGGGATPSAGRVAANRRIGGGAVWYSAGQSHAHP
jgi:hypothetical protein